MSLAAPQTLWESVVMQDHPIAYWALDGGDPLADDSGNGRTLATTAAPTAVDTLLPAEPIDASASGARDFNGSTQFYTASDFDLDHPWNMSVEFWVEFDTVAGTATIISRGTDGIQIRRNGTNLEWGKQGGTLAATTSLGLQAGVVYHVVLSAAIDQVSLDAGLPFGIEGALYVNGALVAASAGVDLSANTNDDWNLGRKSDGTEYLDGKLDEVAVYNYGLTADMVTAHYLAGTEGTFGDDAEVAPSEGLYPRVKLELGLGTVVAPSYQTGGVEQRWVDVTDRLREWGFDRGEGNEFHGGQTSTLAFTLKNTDGALEDHEDAAFYPNVELDRTVRLRYWWPDVDLPVYERYFGYLASIQYRRSPGPEPFVQFAAEDARRLLSLATVKDPALVNEALTGERIEDALSLLPRPTNLPVDLDAGQATAAEKEMQGEGVIGQIDQTVLTEAGGAIFFQAGSGTLVFHDRHHRPLNSTPSATYGEGGFRYQGSDPRRDDGLLYTAAEVTPDSGTVQVASDTFAAIAHGDRTYTASTLHADDAEALTMAEQTVERYKAPRTRVPQIKPQPWADAATARAAWLAWMGHELSDRIAVVEQPEGGLDAVTREAYVDGIGETVMPGRVWECRLRVSPAERERFWILGVSLLGVDTYVAW